MTGPSVVPTMSTPPSKNQRSWKQFSANPPNTWDFAGQRGFKTQIFGIPYGIPIIFPRPTAYAQFQWCSLTLLLVRIDTGRRHQIRSHFAFLQHATVSHWGCEPGACRPVGARWRMVNHGTTMAPKWWWLGVQMTLGLLYQVIHIPEAYLKKHPHSFGNFDGQ